MMGFVRVRIIGENWASFLIAGVSLNNLNDFNGVQKTKIACFLIEMRSTRDCMLTLFRARKELNNKWGMSLAKKCLDML